MRHNDALDGLRGLAAATVVISHFSNRTHALAGLFGIGAGMMGVMLFFVLSGFLMGRLYLDSPPSGAAIATFYRRRIARVVPLYLIVVGLSYYAGQYCQDSYFPPVGSDNVWEHLLFWRGIEVFWTLPVEVQFYVVFPLMWLAFARNPSTTVLGLVFLVALVDLLGFPKIPPVLGYIPFFVAGILASRFRATHGEGMNALFLCALVVYVLMLPQVRAGLGLDALLAGAAPSKRPWESWLYLLTATLVILTGAAAPVARTIFGSRPLRYLGTISYSLYLLHPPVLRALHDVPALHDSPALIAPVFVAALLLVASLSYFLVEAPFRRLINGPERAAR